MGISKDRAYTACRAILHDDDLAAMLLFLDSQLDEAALLRSSLQSDDRDDLIVKYLRRMAGC